MEMNHKGGINEKGQKFCKELWQHNDYANISELKDRTDNEHNENGLRIYCCQHPDTFTFQIRTYKSIGHYRKGVKRDMIAHCNLTIKELEHILNWMKEHKNR